MYEKYIKRVLDIVLSGCGLLISGIPLLLVMLAIRLEDCGPAVFSQTRIGRSKNGELCYFKLWKLRTMHLDAPCDIPTHLMENPEQYFLRCGRALRSMSVDELPQLLNVLRGDMSVVGPRPALWNQDDLVAERERYGANSVRPGLTGWAQVNGRDELDIPTKARLDGEYVKNLSFVFDCKCFFASFIKVLRREGVVEGCFKNVKESASEREKQKAGVK